MKILILANNDIGLYKFRKELIIELLKNHEVFISLPYGDYVDDLVEMGCQFIDTPISRRGINPFTDIKLFKQYCDIMSTINPDRVITYTIKPNIYGGLACRINKIMYFANITGLGTAFQNKSFIRNLVIKMYKIAFKKVRCVFFENSQNLETFVSFKIIRRDKTYQLNGAGVNLDEYPFSTYPVDEKIRFLFVGRIMKEKGIFEFLEAAKLILDETNNVCFDIIGPSEDDIDLSLYTNDHVMYYGYQKDVKPFIEKCHCFVLPSYHEGMANTLLECASMGRPLITTDIHGCKEAVSNNGYLCRPKDKDDLYLKMVDFISLPYEQKKIMGFNSRKHMELNFDKKNIVSETINMLEL